MAMSIAYRIQNVTKVYPGQITPANDSVSFDVQQGEIFGMLGDNGGGKTTLVKQMVGLLRSTSGRIELFGQAIQKDRTRVSLTVGYMPQQSDALNRLTVGEALFFTAHLRGMDRVEASRDRDILLERLGLGNVRNRDNALLSGGQRRLLRLAVAMAGAPPVLILDEPTNDLDPGRRRIVWEVLRALNSENGVTVILITHDPLEAEKVIKRVAILHQGRLVAIGKPSDLKKSLGHDVRVELRFSPEHSPPEEPAFTYELRRPDHWVFSGEWSQVMNFLQSLEAAEIDSVKVYSPTLEDLYLRYVAEG